MQKKYNILSLDPMYGVLHEKIAKLIAIKKYAITSSWSKKIYLPTFKVVPAAKIISQYKAPIDQNTKNIIIKNKNYLSCYLHKIENRELNDIEIEYLSKYYLALKSFILAKEISLVIMQNDTVWHHALAILLCKKLGVKYLVTEQGLIRPHTTTIDNQGVNAYANINYNPKHQYNLNYNNNNIRGHESILGLFLFSVFFISFKLESLFFKSQILRYMHNYFSVKKYWQIFKVRYKKKEKKEINIDCNNILLLLQLEKDSQILVHSHFKSNQDIISKVETLCSKEGSTLSIKKHPLDTNSYIINNKNKFIDADLDQLAQKAKIVITTNSSAALCILKTSTPLYLLGDSIYNLEGIAKKIDINQELQIDMKVNREARNNFLNYIESEYLLTGAGFSYSNQLLEEKLSNLLNY